ncbi:hypothetical protein F4808DRAFT_418650 [Astrocystis sublimbata]|nr:hypothetical protein F4808DRAFT_446799 [Astrocystis sublimbata]KAI0203418.1 hypothetical protein F4808DRAFT_418641 [Astrocystis sublimbata]KAI0203423.1 hypothetical protein F4808DRAFT_418650 [Astrocystis sublimbata]
MSEQLETNDDPPSYAEAAQDSGPTDYVMQPMEMVLAGKSIYAETSSKAPLYELDYDIESPRCASIKIKLKRVDVVVGTNDDDEPSVRDRRRHVFTLERSWRTRDWDFRHPIMYDPLPSGCPRFLARAVPEQGLGHVGLKKARLRSAFTALPVNVTSKGNEFNLPEFAKNAKPVFKLRKGESRWEWEDSEGNDIAVEKELDDTHRLVVTASLPRTKVDTLVALWCSRRWESSMNRTENTQHGLDDIRTKLKLGHDAGVSGLRGWVI